MSLISVPKPLRDKLGEEATDSLVEMFRQKDEEQKVHLFEVLEDRFAHRLVAVESRLMGEIHSLETNIRGEMHSMEKGIREDMNSMEKGIRGDMNSMEKGIREDMNRGFLHMQKQITEVHKAISSQTKWILAAVLGATVIYPIVQQMATRF